VNPNLAHLAGHSLVLEQLKAVGVTLALSVGGTAAIAYAIKAVLGLRPSLEAEEAGLDAEDHGESGYHADEPGHGGLEHIEVPSLQPAAQLQTTG
jgi:Amt family ammonium transporter